MSLPRLRRPDLKDESLPGLDRHKHVLATAATADHLLRGMALRQLEPLALVQPQPEAVQKVFVEVPGILEKLHVKDGMEVKERPVTVPDFMATICKALGIDHEKQNNSNVGRPIRIVEKGADPVKEVLDS